MDAVIAVADARYRQGEPDGSSVRAIAALDGFRNPHAKNPGSPSRTNAGEARPATETDAKQASDAKSEWGRTTTASVDATVASEA